MIKNNTIHQTNNYGNIEILAVGKRPNTHVVRFLNTDTIKEFRDSCILSGCIRDPYAKTVCGVGCTGDVKTKGKYKVYYSIWHDMLHRCYDPKNKRHNSYKNVSVCDEWLVFKNFYNDVSSIQGYDDKLISCGKLVLDKDTKQLNVKNKIYSKDTCIWLDVCENNKIQPNQQRIFIAISPSGEYYEDYNITDFAKNHALNRKNISAVLHGRANTTHGWKFFYKEIV